MTVNCNPFLQEHAKLSKLAIRSTYCFVPVPVSFPDGTVMQVGFGLGFVSIGLGVYVPMSVPSILVPVA